MMQLENQIKLAETMEISLTEKISKQFQVSNDNDDSRGIERI